VGHVPSHYDVLGVAPGSSSEEIRRAYVDLARKLHPDRFTGGERAMQEVNEAWRVLGNPKTRSAYDASLRAPAQTPAPARTARTTGYRPPQGPDDPYPSPVVEPGDFGMQLVRAAPWIAILVVLGAIVVFTAFAAGSDEESRPTPGPVGECVVETGDPEPEQVPCDAPGALEVVLLVSRSSLCPSDSRAITVNDNRWVCVRPVE
jgi:DnaJ domain